MTEDWSRVEVEATVADYFDMLNKEVRGVAYNKTEHRHGLSRLLGGRSDGAIERKHQNISAILIELGFPYILGYKPLRNYQQLLYNVVSGRLKGSDDLVSVVRNQVDQPASVPDFDDILAALVAPPTPAPLVHGDIGSRARETRLAYRGTDYLAKESNNQSLGLAGEQFVVNFEKARLTRAGQERLASQIEHVSATQGDGAGFDVLSFDITGQERLIEVKTTAYGPLTPFFVTRGELDTSHRNPCGYYLYRAFDFRRRPRLFTKQGPLDKTFSLEPTEYVAQLG